MADSVERQWSGLAFDASRAQGKVNVRRQEVVPSSIRGRTRQVIDDELNDHSLCYPAVAKGAPVAKV
ncbi:hypothetical protein SAMN05444352_117105 [Pseudomonas japonica]|uniref:Uncharacterized protein n=1 Tax=Pseudomonas japonica TaxID=256466 RepID=A0A239I455_9PSED|nr:hypothetical protein SAMN05444352_117105 [Pseudomonas japonica]